MKNVKTAKGRILDMGTLAAKNETTRAVSNLNMNARGDIIDNRNEVVIPREKISKEYYKNTVPGADTETISIQAEEKAPDVTAAPKPTAKKETTKKAEAALTEVTRTTRTRDNGTSYFEVEYSDGSMEEIEIGDK